MPETKETAPAGLVAAGAVGGGLHRLLTLWMAQSVFEEAAASNPIIEPVGESECPAQKNGPSSGSELLIARRGFFSSEFAEGVAMQPVGRWFFIVATVGLLGFLATVVWMMLAS